jgi:uncharacterized protein (DUF305 family)
MKRTCVLATLALLLAGCGGPAVSPAGGPAGGGEPTGTAPVHTASPPPPVSPSGAFNATDVMFLQMMVAQYGPAAQLLQAGRDRSASERVRTLAAAIAVTQADELATMRQWLHAWGQPDSAAADPALHAGHGGLPATGPQEIAALAATPAAGFDKAFLNLLLGQQHQAVEYARMELSAGTHAGALELATRIDQSRSAQITMMLAMVA